MIEPRSPRMVSERSRGAANPQVSRATIPELKARQPTEKSGAMSMSRVPGPLSWKATAEKP